MRSPSAIRLPDLDYGHVLLTIVGIEIDVQSVPPPFAVKLAPASGEGILESRKDGLGGDAIDRENLGEMPADYDIQGLRTVNTVIGSNFKHD